MFKAVNLKKLLISLLIPFLAALLAQTLSGDIKSVYQSLNQPPGSPPALVFPVVWAILYLLMGLSLYIISISRAPQQKKSFSYIVFGTGLLFNIFWPILFFRFGLLNFSAVWLGVLILLIALNIFAFCRIKKAPGIMLLPYLIWCLFALYLNIGAAVLN